METMKFGLMLTIIPFIVIFQFITVWWAVADISVKKIRGARRAWWTFLVILMPPVGTLIYSFLNRDGDIAPPHTNAPIKVN